MRREADDIENCCMLAGGKIYAPVNGFREKFLPESASGPEVE